MNEFDFENINNHIKSALLVANHKEHEIDNILKDEDLEIKIINLSFYQRRLETKDILKSNNMNDFLVLVFNGEERTGEKSWAFTNDSGKLTPCANKGLMEVIKYLKADYQEAIADHLRKNENKAIVEECIKDMIIHHETYLSQLIENNYINNKKEIPKLVQHRRI